MKNQWLLIVLALCSIGIALFFNSYETTALKAPLFHLQPQEYMTHFTVTVFSETGRVKETLSAHYWAFEPQKKGSTLAEPRLVVDKADGTRWLIQAKNGFIKQPHIGKIEKIYLKNNVVLHRPGMNQHPPLTIESEQIDYDPHNAYAESQTLVTLKRPDLTLSGVGMRAFLNENKVELLHQVKTHYLSIH